MTKTHALISLFLLTLISSCASAPTCAKRPAYTGSTYGDEIAYCHAVEDLYDSCSKK